jgi:hypothetical protein
MQFMDANGEPLVAGKLYTYASGTTTPLATYTDATGTVANTNPVILDTTGSAAVWCGSAQYAFTLKTSTDVLVWTADNLNAPQASTLAALAAAGGAALIGTAQGTTVQTQLSHLSGVDGAAYVTYKQDSLFSVSTDVSAKLNEWVSVKDFGGNTTPGTTDMTSVFNTAFATTTGGLCVVPGIEAYKLTTAPTNINTGILTLGGTYVTNAPPGMADTSVYGKSPFILQQYQDHAASATPLSGNEFSMVIMSTTPVSTGSTGSYQKGPLYLRMVHNEPSTYGPFVGHDAVGMESQGILNTASDGRGWSHHGLLQIPVGCDGYGVGYEIEIINSSGNAGTSPIDEQTSKNGIQIVSRSGIASKAIGIVSQPGGGTNGSWAHGIVFYPEAINTGGSAMIVPALAPISIWNAGAYPTTWFSAFYGDASDNLVIGDGATSISLATPVNCVQGLNTTRAYITAATGPGTTTELVLGNSTSATAGAVVGYLNMYIGATAYKIPYHAV